jgi:hypothetical protein
VPRAALIGTLEMQQVHRAVNLHRTNDC